MIRSLAITSILLGSLVLACAGGGGSTDPSTGANDEQLQKKDDGSATGNGTTCSWQGTALASTYGNATYSVGASVPSIDGCNTCECSAQGILCTVMECSPPDGGAVACPALARVCKDGSSPTPGPNCEQTCPEDSASSCNSLQNDAKSTLDAALARDIACTTSDDCVATQYALSCIPGCSTVIAKASQGDWTKTRDAIEADQCTKFHGQSCTLAPVACPAIGIIPQCINNKCAGGE